MNHSPVKHRKLYKLLKDKELMFVRHDLVFSFSDGETEDSSELSDKQIDGLLEYLRNYGHDLFQDKAAEGCQRMRRRILSMCYTLGWTRFDPCKERHMVDMERLEAWMIKYSYLHKALNDYTYQELPTVVTQFENMLKTEL